MMHELVNAYLEQDEALKELLKGTDTDTHISAMYADYKEESNVVIFTVTPQGSDGIVKKDRVQVKVIGETLTELEKIVARIDEMFITVSDRPIGFIMHGEQNGGGVMPNLENNTITLIRYYDILTRSELNG